jgi:hypothetical protein
VITHVTSVLAQDALIDLNFAGLIDRFWANTIDGLSYGSIYALVAIGYTLVYGVLRLINFAHSEIFVIGIFAAYFTFAALGFAPGESPELGLFALIGSLLVVALVAMAASGGSAVLLERVCYRPLRKRGAPPLVFLITAIGASFAIQQIFLITLGANSQPTIRILRPTEVFEVFGARVTNIQIMTVVAAIVLMRPGGVPGSGDGHAHGREPRAGLHAHVPARRRAGRRGRAVLPDDHPGGRCLQRRLPPRHQGVHRRGAGRDREPARRPARRVGAGRRGELRPDVLRR